MGVYGQGVYGSGIYDGDTDLSLTVQTSVWPARVLLTVNRNVEGTTVTIQRRAAGEAVSTPVRGGDSIVTTDSDVIILTDHEAPYGIALTYELVVNGLVLDTELVTLTLDGGKVAISDAITSRAAEVVVLSWPDKAYGRDSTTFRINGRKIVVLGDLDQPESDLDLYTETTDQLNNVLLLIEQATEGTIQIRQPGGYDDVDAYLAVLAVDVKRWSQDGSDERRIVGLSVAETDGWAPGLVAGGFTFADVGAAFSPGDDFADFAAMFAGQTFLAPAVADWA